MSSEDEREQYLGSVNPPIFQSSLFTFPNYAEFSEAFGPSSEGEASRPVYTRGTNPTTRALEKKVALLEKAEDARAFGSGIAAIAAAVLHSARAGDHVVAPESVYSNTFRLLHDYLPTLGITTTFADFTDMASVEDALKPETRLLYLESPANPGMQITDLDGVAKLASRRGLTTAIDNTMASPYNQRPIEQGIDLVIHSATKYLAGHSDVVAGIVAGSRDRMRSISASEIRDLGGILGPFDAWLVLRGIRTLGLRMREANVAGQRVAEWLEAQPRVVKVHYPGLASHPQHALAARQMRGFGSLLSFVIAGGFEAATRFVDALRLFSVAVSWGGFESLALPFDPPTTMAPETAARVGMVPGLIRLSIGLEDVDDLIDDLNNAFASL